MRRAAFLRRMALVALASGLLPQRVAAAAEQIPAQESACPACGGSGEWSLGLLGGGGAMVTTGYLPDHIRYEFVPCGACREDEFLLAATPPDHRIFRMLEALYRAEMPTADKGRLCASLVPRFSARTLRDSFLGSVICGVTLSRFLDVTGLPRDLPPSLQP